MAANNDAQHNVRKTTMLPWCARCPINLYSEIDQHKFEKSLFLLPSYYRCLECIFKLTANRRTRSAIYTQSDGRPPYFAHIWLKCVEERALLRCLNVLVVYNRFFTISKRNVHVAVCWAAYSCGQTRCPATVKPNTPSVCACGCYCACSAKEHTSRTYPRYTDDSHTICGL